VDDSAVEALLQADELAGQLDESQAALDRIEAEWNSEQASLRQQEVKLKQNYVLLKRKRDALANEMGPALLRQYDGMRKRRAGIAIAPVQNGVCGACHVQVPTGVISAVRGSGTNLVLCPSCGRYLYSP
jgi:predicted  nucleic acid-binding Zn-ribbon protein